MYTKGVTAGGKYTDFKGFYWFLGEKAPDKFRIVIVVVNIYAVFPIHIISLQNIHLRDLRVH